MATQSLSSPTIFLALLLACGCGDDGGGDSSSLTANWTFANGDCATNGVETVKITRTKSGGSAEEAEFPCADGSGDLGELDGGGTYDISAQGLDAEGAVRAQNFGQSVTFGAELPPDPSVDVTLHPSPSDVVAKWSGCPQGVTLPYFITIYQEPSEPGGDLTEKVAEVQESCMSGEATLANVAPGSYIVELDSRAVTPAVYATAPVTVLAGEPAEVTLTF